MTLQQMLAAAVYLKSTSEVAFNSFNPTASGRRTYSGTGSFASPNFLDNPGWTWVAGGPQSLTAKGYQLQMRFTADRFEPMNGQFANHAYALAIAGVQIGPTLVNNPSNAFADTGYFNVGASVAGAVTFHDWATNSNAIGGSSFVGNVVLYYKYSRV